VGGPGAEVVQVEGTGTALACLFLPFGALSRFLLSHHSNSHDVEIFEHEVILILSTNTNECYIELVLCHLLGVRSLFLSSLSRGLSRFQASHHSSSHNVEMQSHFDKESVVNKHK